EITIRGVNNTCANPHCPQPRRTPDQVRGRLGRRRSPVSFRPVESMKHRVDSGFRWNDANLYFAIIYVALYRRRKPIQSLFCLRRLFTAGCFFSCEPDATLCALLCLLASIAFTRFAGNPLFFAALLRALVNAFAAKGVRIGKPYFFLYSFELMPWDVRCF